MPARCAATIADDGCCLLTATIVTLDGERFTCRAARATRSTISARWSVISVTLCPQPLAILSTSYIALRTRARARERECYGRGRHCATARICRQEQRFRPALVFGCPADHPR